MLNNEKSATGGKIKRGIIFSLAIVFAFSFFAVREARAQNCPGSCQVACSSNQNELQGPFQDCGNMACCENQPSGGGNCPGSCQVACSNNQDELQGPFQDCGSMACCQNSSGGGGGCCVVSPGNCLDTPGTSCSYGNYYPGSCSSNPDCSSSDQPVGTGIEIPKNTGLPDAPIKNILSNFLTWLLGILGIIAIIAFIISGLQYLTAAGSEDQMETAKRNMMYSIMGVVVALASFVIIQAIDAALRAQSIF